MNEHEQVLQSIRVQVAAHPHKAAIYDHACKLRDQLEAYGDDFQWALALVGAELAAVPDDHGAKNE